MNIELIPDSFSQDEYNAVAQHPLQAWEWGETRKGTGVGVIRLGEFNEGKLINVFQMTLHKVPRTVWKIGYIPRSVFPSDEVINFLYNFGKNNQLIFIKIEPYVRSDQTPSYKLQANKLTASPHPLFPKWTQLLDITPSEEDLLKKMKSKTRYNIRLAERKGVQIKEVSDHTGFETFINLYFSTTRRQKYFGHSRSYHEIIWKHLKHTIAHILIAYYDNIPLSAYELFYFKNTLYYPYGGSSEKHREVMASNLLMWEAIKLGKKLGAETFDMWGSLPPGDDVSKDWGGFTRFKEGYGTEFVEFVGSYDLVINKPLYLFYSFAHRLRKSFLDIKSHFLP